MSPAVRTRIVTVLDVDGEDGAGIERCWLEVSNAGGAVGFPFGPVTADDVRAATVRLIGEVDSGAVRLVVAEDDELVGWVSLRLNASRLTRHWATVERLQCRPQHRGRGVGSQLVRALEEDAVSLGLEQLRLVLRGGEGLEGFYERLGWTEFGRHRAALRLADGDDRDEVFMSRALRRIGRS